MNEEPWTSGHLFFYLADEDDNALSLSGDTLDIHDNSLLTSGSRMDIGSWQLHLKSQVKFPKVCSLFVIIFRILPFFF